MLLLCVQCDVRSRNCDDWYYHLTSDRHQDMTKVMLESCTAEMKDRTIVCWKLGAASWEKDWVKYFSSFSILHDIYFHRSIVDNSIKACLVLLDSELAATAALECLENRSQKNLPTYIGKHGRRTDIHYSEWEKIFGSATQEIFMKRHNGLIEACEDLSLEEQFYEFVSALSLSDGQVVLRQRFLSELRSILKKEFAFCDLKPFGSFLTGIGDSDADLDVYVDVDTPGVPQSTSRDERKKLTQQKFDGIAKILRMNNPWITVGRRRVKRFKSIIPLPARIPIVILEHSETKLHADLSFSSVISVENSKFIKFAVEYDPRVRPIMIFLRYWGRFHQLLGSDKIKTYALVLMVVVYLNQQQIIPSLDFLQTFRSIEPFVVDGWNVAFVKDIEEVRKVVAECTGCVPNEAHDAITPSSILKLLKGFFHYYGNMDLDELIICPLLGTTLDKSMLFNEEHRLPSDLPFTSEKIRMFRYQSALCVQDPFVLDFNVTSNVREEIADRFKGLCLLTETYFEEVLASDKCNMLTEVFVDFYPPGKVKEKAALQVVIDTWSKLADESDSVVETFESHITESESETDPLQSQSKSPTAPTIAIKAKVQEVPVVNTDKKGQPEISLKLSKSSIDNLPRGNQFEIDFQFTIPEDFKMLFIEGFKYVNNTEDEDLLLRKMKIIWVQFVLDFLSHIWDQGFGLSVTKEKKMDYQFSLGTEAIQAETLLPYTLSLNKYEAPANGSRNLIARRVSKESDNDSTNSSRSSLKRRLSPTYIKNIECDLTSLDFQSKPIKRGREKDFTTDFAISDQQSFEIVGDLQDQPPKHEKGSNNDLDIIQYYSLPPLKDEAAQLALQEKFTKIPTGFMKSYSQVFTLKGNSRMFTAREHFDFKNYMENSVDPLNINPIPLLQKQEMVTLDLEQDAKDVTFTCVVSVQSGVPRFVIHLEAIVQNPVTQMSVIDFLQNMDFSIMLHQHTLFRLFRFVKRN